MDGDVVSALNAFRAYAGARSKLGGNPFRLACSFDDPATTPEIEGAYPGGQVPADLVRLWSTCGGARLFEDVDYGQWGLVLLSPAASAQRTTRERAQRPHDYRPGDVVIGEFLGDQELVVLTPSEGREEVLIALPLDDREEWLSAAGGIAEFLSRYRDALGNEFWEHADDRPQRPITVQDS